MSQVRELLKQAYESLPSDIILNHEVSLASFDDYHSFMKHHEWELAIETLEELALNTNPSIAFWKALSEAARVMKSYSNLSRYEANLR